MNAPHEARFYQPLEGRRVLCTLCPHDCNIAEGGRGACGVRFNHEGKLYTVAYERVVSRSVDPIEKKPLFHFYPGSTAYSIATVGCNLRCAFCQNWQISQWPKDHLPKHMEEEKHASHEPVCPTLSALGVSMPGTPATPRKLVSEALASGALSVAYTYTEPTVFYELAYDTAKLARKRGLKNIFVSNGFTSEAAIRELATVLDAVNIDLKFFTDEAYRRISRARLMPILDAIRLYHALGVWVEVTTLVIPGVNDSDKEMRDIAEFIASVSVDIPWHVSQFYPGYHMQDRPPTPLRTLHRAERIGRAAGLRYVYSGNVPGDPGEDTYCYRCRALLIDRESFFVRNNRIVDGRCPDCGTVVGGQGMSPVQAVQKRVSL